MTSPVPFSESARSAITESRDLAIRVGSPCVTPELILLSMLQAETKATLSLRSLGIDLLDLAVTVRDRAVVGDQEIGGRESASLALDDTAEAVVKGAVDEAHGGNVDAEHLLLAMLRIDSRVKAYLNEANVTYDSVRAIVGSN